MTWLLFAVLTAFFDSLKVVFGKFCVNKLDIFLSGWAWRFFALPVLLPVLFFFPLPEIRSDFWWALAVSGIMNVVITLIFMKAIQSSGLSLTMPMITFTPLFLLLTSPLMIGEFPTLKGLAGILLIVGGAYILNLPEWKKGLFAPFRALFIEKGPRLMLLVAFLWSITSNIDKIGVNSSSPLVWAASVNGVMVILLFPLTVWKSKGKTGKIRNNFWPLFLMGISAGLVLVFQMFAVKLTLVAYVISIKRVSAGLSVLWGFFLFKEKKDLSRLFGVIIMLAGVFLIGWTN